MKVVLGGLLIGLAMMSQPALAQPRGFGPWLQAQGHRAPPPGPPQRAQRGDRGERNAAPERGQRRQGRLTDEERRELRRDIDQANRDIYRRKFKR